MNLQKKYVLPAIMLTILGGSMIAVRPAQAFFGSDNGQDTMVKELATQLGVSEDKVKSAMDTIHQKHEQEREQKMQEKLDSLVSQGKITAEQKTAFVAKLAEHKKQMDAIRDDSSLTDEQRREKMKTLHDELKQWLTDQGLSDIGIMGGKFGHVRGGPH